MISASWDCAARVWSRNNKPLGDAAGGKVKSKAGDWECEYVLSGHEAAVWGVAILDGGLYDGHYLTGESRNSESETSLYHIEFARFGRSDLEDVRYPGDGCSDLQRIPRCD